jgi:mannobiose 2-epimerase
MDDRIQALSLRMSRELRGNILPFWLRLEDRTYGGHYGRMEQSGQLKPNARKPAVFVSRLLWTLTEAGRVLSLECCIEQARRTKQFLLDYLVDHAHGGLFWSVTHDGRPLETEKYVYAQAFGVYALAAYARATGDAEALAAAHALFNTIESRSRLPTGGYAEAFDTNWRPQTNRRPWTQGIGSLSANTYLHLVEAYTELSRVSADRAPHAALCDLLMTILELFVADDGSHSHPYLDAQLHPQSGPIAYGHDIEISWLIKRAGETLADQALQHRLRPLSASQCRGTRPGCGWRLVYDQHRPNGESPLQIMVGSGGGRRRIGPCGGRQRFRRDDRSRREGLGVY